MGIQIIIKLESLRDINTKVVNKTFTDTCPCGYTTGFCSDCNTSGTSREVEFLDIEGIDFLMHMHYDTCWHDANLWGNSREPLLAFIDKHRLVEGQDWFES